jgi:hypothetical protein
LEKSLESGESCGHEIALGADLATRQKYHGTLLGDAEGPDCLHPYSTAQLPTILQKAEGGQPNHGVTIPSASLDLPVFCSWVLLSQPM